MRSEYHDSIECVPDKMDQLSEVLNQVRNFYGEGQKYLS